MPAPERRERFDPELAAALERLELLIGSFENDADPAVRERAFELLRSVDAVHRAGLTRLAGYLNGLDRASLERLLADPPVRLLLELYDLLPAESPGFVPLEEIENMPPSGP